MRSVTRRCRGSACAFLGPKGRRGLCSGSSIGVTIAVRAERLGWFRPPSRLRRVAAPAVGEGGDATETAGRPEPRKTLSADCNRHPNAGTRAEPPPPALLPTRFPEPPPNHAFWPFSRLALLHPVTATLTIGTPIARPVEFFFSAPSVPCMFTRTVESSLMVDAPGGGAERSGAAPPGAGGVRSIVPSTTALQDLGDSTGSGP